MASDQLLDEIAAGQGKKIVQLARLLPPNRGDRPVSLSCIVRWILQGHKTPDGGRVRLEAARTPDGWISTAGALRRFFSALTPDLSDHPVPAPRSASKRERAAAAAGAELEAAGA